MYGNFFQNLGLITLYLWKIPGYPQFALWILVALAKICFFHSLKPHKNIVVLVGKFLKKPE